MRTAFDFSPLYRSSIGFDRVFDLLENASRTTTIDNCPNTSLGSARRLPHNHGGGRLQPGRTVHDAGAEYARRVRSEVWRRHQRYCIAALPGALSSVTSSCHHEGAGAPKNGPVTIDLKREIPKR